MTLGSSLATLLVLALAQVQTLPMFYLIWAGIGVTMAMVLYEPAFAVVATWFIRQRSRALTLLTLGGGLASVVFVPLTEVLVSAYGWRQALMLLAGLLAVITVPLHALLLRRSPAQIGSLPDGAPAPAVGHPIASTEPALSLHAALRQQAFWWLTGAFALNLLASVALGVHLIPLLIERGESTAFAALALAVLGGSQLPGRLLFGPLSERLARRQATAVLFGLQLLGLLVLLGVPSHAGILIFAALFGAGAGASSPARAALVADMYGAQHYGRISGVLALLLTLARAGAPLGASAVYAGARGYTPLLWLATALIGAATVAVLLVHEHQASEQAVWAQT
jgi:predicted MFS family arabinose efflux permease